MNSARLPLGAGRLGLACTASAIALFSAGIAGAQPAPPAGGGAPATATSSSLEEVVVTARRRQERLQDVPVSVTALSGEQLARQNVTTALDLGKTSPSLTVTPSPRGSNTPFFVIRGQRLIDTSMVLDPVTVVYFNEIPEMRPQGLNGAMYDLQSVQVLRGPQGTLFGRNTTGGAVLVTSAPPTRRFEGYANVTLGNYANRLVELAVNMPLGDKAALRIAGVYHKRDGYMTNRLLGTEQNDQDYNGQRITLRLDPTDRLTSTFFADRFWSDDHGAANQIYAVEPTASTAGLAPALRAEIAANQAALFTYASNVRGQEKARTVDISNITTYKLADTLSIKNIVGYRRVKTHSNWDLDGSSFFIQNLYGDTSAHQISEELQLLGNGRNYDWILGGFYFREKGSDLATSFLVSSPTIGRPSGVVANNTSYSFFGSGTYRFDDYVKGLSLSTGYRYTWDDRSAQAVQRVGAGCGIRLNDGTLACSLPEHAKFNQPSWSVSVNYKFNPALMVYVAHRHGYRSGGVQSRVTTQAASVPFAPEKVNDIELGMKGDFNLGGMKARLNADVYWAKYKNLQRQISFISPVAGTLVSGLFNAASSRVRGFEVEGTLLPIDGLELTASTGYVDTRYLTFVNAGKDISSWPFSYVPRWTVNAQAVYTLPLDPAIGTVRASYSFRHQSKIIDSDTPQPDAVLPGYSISDIRVDWDHIRGSRYGLSAYVTNLTNAVYFPYGTNLTSSLGVATHFLGEPRMFGFQGRASF